VGASLVVRSFTVGLGLAGMAWGLLTLPVSWSSAALEDVATRIVHSQAFRLETLLELTPTLEAVEHQDRCDAASARSAAIVRLRIAEVTLGAADGPNIDSRFAAARASIVNALKCSPVDSFLWLSLFWIESTTNGFKPEYLELLRLSYQQGPDEGWVMEKRSRLALAIYRSLPPDLAERAVGEFAKLLQPQFTVTAADIFAGPGWPIRDILLPRLASAPLSERQLFSNLLYARNIDVAVPGIVRDERPYRR
jgi:hypothetical protein